VLREISAIHKLPSLKKQTLQQNPRLQGNARKLTDTGEIAVHFGLKYNKVKGSAAQR